jgi:hypothetical protein
MPTPPLTDELAGEAVAALKQHGTKGGAARALGLDPKTYRNRLKIAAQRGMMLDVAPAMPGFRVSRVNEGPNGRSVEQKPEHGPMFEMPPGHVLKGVSALVDEDGREIVKWYKTKEGQFDPTQLVAWIKDAYKDVRPARTIKAPPAVRADLLTLVPCADWHIGMFAWGKEVGQNWDLKIAERTIGAAIEDVILRSPPSAEAIVLGGGDLMHADNKENQTAKSGNALEVDGRWPKVLQAAGRLAVRTIDAARRRHKHVIVRILPGNHDEHSAIAIAYFLLAYYRNDKRVTVDVDPSLFFWHRFGRVLIGATHGHTVKIAKMPAIMAHRRAADWGATRFRYVHGFHLHHSAKTATEGEGVITEIHQAPIPQDAWHFGSGFLSGRSVAAITYHREFGEIGRDRAAILDGAKAR